MAVMPGGRRCYPDTLDLSKRFRHPTISGAPISLSQKILAPVGAQFEIASQC
jgi:hypothetical protein